MPKVTIPATESFIEDFTWQQLKPADKTVKTEKLVWKGKTYEVVVTDETSNALTEYLENREGSEVPESLKTLSTLFRHRNRVTGNGSAENATQRYRKILRGMTDAERSKVPGYLPKHIASPPRGRLPKESTDYIDTFPAEKQDEWYSKGNDN